MDLGLKNRIAMVSGGSSGIGEAVAYGLAKEGAKVIIFSRDERELELAAQRIGEATGQAILFLTADVTVQGEIDRLISGVIARFARIDLLVNAAGSGFPGDFESVSDEDWTNNFELNFLGTVRCSRGVIPHMRSQGGGSIVNIAAISARQPRPLQIVSNATKAAVLNLSKTLAIKYAKDHIRINCVNPGQILGPRRKRRLLKLAQEQGLTEEAVVEKEVRDIPLGRFGLPEEIVGAVLLLLSDQASFITGASIDVDGGETRSV